MKKILFAFVCALTFTLTSCLKEGGYSSTQYAPTIVTIDTTTTPISFKDFYTGQVFKNVVGLQYPEDLQKFKLGGATLVYLNLRVDTDAAFRQTITALGGEKVETLALTNTTPTDSLKPFTSLFPLVDYGLYTPTVLVRDGYLNVCPITPSSQEGTCYLMPEKVGNDTLYFKLKASYTENKEAKSYKSLFYNLRTLRDTAQADATLRTKMTEMLNTLSEQRGDSMYIALMYDEITYNVNHQGKDTIKARIDISNFFEYNF